MIRIKTIITVMVVALGLSCTSTYADEPELEVSQGKSATIVNTTKQTEADASAFFTGSGYFTANNNTALGDGMAMNWGDRGYIDIDFENDVIVTRIEWTKNHVYGALGTLNVYASNSPDFSGSVSLGEVVNGEGEFLNESYYRYIRLEKATNYDFYPGRIKVYGYKRPFVFNGITNTCINSDSVLELLFSEKLSNETNIGDIKINKSGKEINTEISVVDNKISITPTEGFVEGGIYELVIPPDTVIADDTRTFNEEIKEYFAVSTDKLEILQYSFENNVLSFNMKNKTTADMNVSLWVVGYENSVSGVVSEYSYSVGGGQTFDDEISIPENYSVFMFEDCENMKQLLSNFRNIIDADVPENIPEEISVQYVDGAVVVGGSSEATEMTAIITDDDAVVSAAEVKAISTVTVKDGKFYIKLVLNSDFDSGNYAVWVSDGTIAAEDYNVYVLDEFDKQEYAEDIADMSADDLKLFFENEDNKKILDGIGIITDRPQNLTGLYTAIEATELSGTYGDIAEGINTQISLAIVKEKGFVYGVSHFNDYLKIDTTDSLYNYVTTNDLLDEAQSFMENKFVDVTQLTTEIFNSFKLAVFTNALSVDYAQEFAGLNNDFFCFDFEGDYRVLNKVNKKKVISAAMKGENLIDIREKFERSATEYKKKQQAAQNTSTSGNSSSSGGGGGISSPKPSIVLPEVKVDELKDTTVQDENNVVFSDLPQSHWAYKSVSRLAEEGIVSGFENKFNPDNNITREEFVKMLTEAAKIENDGESRFADVPSEAWYYPYISRAFNSGIVNGISDTEFGVGKNITRQDMSVMIYNTILFCKADVKTENVHKEFTDYMEISDYAKEAVDKLVGMNLINGRENNNFAPLNNSTRAEAATLICRMLDCIG